ncbi:MAG: 50S ribosomal protein L19 [Candidatus Yonathbacteria bacterium RIFCSPHIGHO2_01_FULL_51_10]|uniref:50S ribosomal protein L19 n=1 Tax=Candidatus Yonathbacteria bacterium RIFCSPHIGHO2_01_FULL_51_10 TaxID=1802723 RepID=A0A1G2S7M1_9BACT|nr:MAG: 50S ribosomal protein L19 [Candidatus Yonathbacteria bacterium RIFCSPHIGHO2_01_FULL_51_10]
MAISLTPVNVAARTKLDIRSGDTVRVSLKIEEKGKTRLQAFEGLVIAVKHGKSSGGTFTVRKNASSVGVEKTFPIFAPVIEKIEVLRRSKVRRSKLYYIREKVAREVSHKMRNMMIMAGRAGSTDIAEAEEEIELPLEESTEVTPATDAPEVIAEIIESKEAETTEEVTKE